MSANLFESVSPPPVRFGGPGISAILLRGSAAALAFTSLISALLFGLYILAFYAGAIVEGNMTQWNRLLPRIYEANTPAATFTIGVHFAAGGILLVLGGIQLISALRASYPALHRWIGRVYVTAALLTGLGGLAFIAIKGTVGGMPMNIGFSLYGALTVLAATQTFRHARMRQLDAHRAWALRLFALVIGSWLYRMEYGFWKMLADGVGHAKDFSGPFDAVMSFFFYLPNLLVAEAFIRARRITAPPTLKLLATGVLTSATAFLVVGSYYFTKRHWGPAILHWVVG